jgi:hypothetical protein
MMIAFGPVPSRRLGRSLGVKTSRLNSVRIPAFTVSLELPKI